MRRRMSADNGSDGRDGKHKHSSAVNNNLAIAWIDLTFRGQSHFWQESKPILNGISGSIHFGSLNALMGPSGAGKSTLLKCINGRQKQGIDRRSTDIYLSAYTKIRSCFIVQDISEHLLNGLTAMQSLIYASKLKNTSEEDFDHKTNARNLLSDLMISDIERTQVEKCSGGEQKRLAIALELTAVHKPNLLCIDEPTSGLDSNAAEIVINCLKEVTRKHSIAIVTSIHQPNTDVLMLFDKLYVLAKKGYCVYEGPPLDLRDHLNAAQVECNENQVPIEVLLKTASKYDQNVERLSELCLKSKTDLRLKCITNGKLSPKGIQHKSPAFSLKRMWFLFQRTITYTLRSQWKAMVIQFVFIVSQGFVVTKLYNKHIGEPDGCFSFETQNNNMSCVKTVETLKIESYLSQNLRLQFFAAILIQFLTTVSTTLAFTTEVRVFLNEHKNGWYSTGSYYWAKSVVELPLCLLITVCYGLIVYNGNNQINDQNRMFGYLAVLIAGSLCSQGLGLMIGITANSNDKLAIVLAVGAYLVNVMLCGFFAPIDEWPEEIRWISHISFAKQSFEIMLTLIYGFDRCPAGYIASTLYQMNLRDGMNEFWINGFVLGFQIINFRFLALFVLLIKANPISFRFPKRAQNKNEKISVQPMDVITHM